MVEGIKHMVVHNMPAPKGEITQPTEETAVTLLRPVYNPEGKIDPFEPALKVFLKRDKVLYDRRTN